MADELTDRQVEVLNYAARGLRDAEIGAQMELAHQTVRHTLMAARKKLNARNTTHAVALALSQHLITLEE